MHFKEGGDKTATPTYSFTNGTIAHNHTLYALHLVVMLLKSLTLGNCPVISCTVRSKRIYLPLLPVLGHLHCFHKLEQRELLEGKQGYEAFFCF